MRGGVGCLDSDASKLRTLVRTYIHTCIKVLTGRKRERAYESSSSYIRTPQLPFPFPECKIGMQKSSSSTFLHSTIKSACFASKCLTYIHIQQVRVPCLAFLSFPSALGFSILVLPTLPYLGPGSASDQS